MNRDVLTVIATRADDEVLKLLSQTPLWSTLVPQFSNQHFWYLRTEARFDLPDWLSWERNAKENWHEIYNILSATKNGNPFLEVNEEVLIANRYNTKAVKYLLELGAHPAMGGNRSLGLAAGYGSLEVVKLLLADPSVDNALQQRLPIRVLHNAAREGRLDTLQVLLEHPPIRDRLGTDPGRDIILAGLVGAATTNQVEAAKLLLGLRKFAKEDLKGAAETAAGNDSADVLELILDHVGGTGGVSFDLLGTAAKSGSANALQLLFERDRDGHQYPSYYRAWFIDAVEADQPETALVVMEDSDNLYGAHALELASGSAGPKVMKMLLEDETLTTRDIENAIKDSIDGPVEALAVLLSDPRASDAGELIAGLIYQADNIEAKNLLLKTKQLDLADIRPKHLAHILWLVPRISDSLWGAVKLSGSDVRDLQEAHKWISDVCNDYNKCHYDMLLREIVMRGLDLGYYIDWLTKNLRRQETSQRVRQLISSAAASVLDKRSTVHTSDDFTAYSGFLLLANSRNADGSYDGQAVMNTLETEEGVTDEGLRRAGILIGAFVGRERLTSQ